MEYFDRTHKEVPFGWLAALQCALSPRCKSGRALRPTARRRSSGGLA